MPRTSRKEETSIKITKELADLIDQLIREGKMGYRSRQEFCNDAIRRLVDHYWAVLGAPGSSHEEER